ncbi:MAG: hypothetical protein LBK53_08050 [Heliobacteriaceae bacterium]|jgi:hypothetical protein|nr:hypothetical protein [Heliobacteriaceae bacterium]
MKILGHDKTSFGGFYNSTTMIQENSLLNRGILDLGGIGIPQAAMSNNKTEALERGTMSALYFVASFLTPFIMLPFFNKKFLSSQNIIKDFTNNEKLIMEVPKKYLTKGTDYLFEGIRKTADVIKNDKLRKVKVDPTQDFENIIKRFAGRGDELHAKLVKTHEKVLMWDFLTTSWMWVSIPWLVTESSRLFTKRDDFSALHKMKAQEKFNEKKHKEDKLKHLGLTALLATLPGLITSKVVMKAVTSKSDNIIKKYANNFNYTQGKFMSKTIFALMWGLSDYPAALVSSRDKHERKDRSIRFGAMAVLYFAVDPLVNLALGKASDKVLKTRLMDKRGIKDLRQISEMKDVPEHILKRTKNAAAGIYWTGILMALAALGFGLPALMNAMLRNTIKKENSVKSAILNLPLDKKLFKDFGF